MRAAFLGTPSAAVPPLAALLDVADVPLVITRPDAAKGRSGRPTAPPVKLAAQEWGLPVTQPASGSELRAALQDARADVGVVVAYGRILSAEVLATTRVGFVNLHFSLLPRWRGAAPVERCLLAGDELTGISFMKLDEGMDTGPIISAIETPVADDETGGTLTARLSYLAGVVLADSLPSYMSGALDPAPQISAAATYAARLHRDEGRLDTEQSAAAMGRQVRAFTPRPGAWVQVDRQPMKIWAATPTEVAVTPGRIELHGGEVLLGAGDGSLRLDRVQPAGGRRLDAIAWMHGRRDEPIDVDT